MNDSLVHSLVVYWLMEYIGSNENISPVLGLKQQQGIHRSTIPKVEEVFLFLQSVH